MLRWWSNKWNVIDEFIFFSRAVTAKEVDEIFKKGIDGALSVDGTGKCRPFGPI